MSVEIIKVKENSIHTYPLILCCTWASFMSNLGISAVAKIGEKERRRKVVDWAQEVVDKPYNDIKAVGQLVDSELRWYLLKSLVELFRIRPVAQVVNVITIPAWRNMRWLCRAQIFRKNSLVENPGARDMSGLSPDPEGISDDPGWHLLFCYLKLQQRLHFLYTFFFLVN